jgi:hypothetical protein
MTRKERRKTHKKIRREMHQFLYFSTTKLVFVILLTRLLLILHCGLKIKKKLNVKKKITSRFLDIIIKFGTIN